MTSMLWERFLFVSTFIIFSLSVTSATIRSSNESSVCNETGSSVYLTPGDMVTLECTVTNNVPAANADTTNTLEWVSGFTLTLSSSQQTPPSSGGFTATVISFNNSPGSQYVTANLTFTVSEADDERVIRCTNRALDDTDTCTLLVCTKPSPTEVMATAVSCDSVYLTWTAPTDTGGCTVNYTITVTPLNGVDSPFNIITDGTNYIVDGLKVNQGYNFTVTASNRAGVGGTSMTVTRSTVRRVPDQVSTDVCLLYNTTGTYLNVSWNLTPCVDNYLVTVNGSSPLTVDSGSSQVNYPLDNSAEGNHTVNVSAMNTVGINVTVDSFDSRWFQNIHLSMNYSAFQAILNVVTVSCLQTSEDLDIRLTYYGNDTEIDEVDYMENTVISFTLSSLTPGDNIDYTLEVVGPNGIIISRFTSSFILTSPSPTPSPSPTSIPDPTSTEIVTTSTMSSMPPSSPLPDDSLPIAPIAGGVGGGVALLVVIGVLIGVGGFCVVKKKNKTEVDLGKMRRNSDGPIALVDRQAAVPETGQALYQDPDTIQREKAPTTGDLYALPDKPRRNAPTTPPAPHQPELATYQDPNTIQREQAPTGDLYALPEKKPVYSQVNKENKEQGIVYAELGLDNPSSSGPGYNPNTVLYADVNVKQQ